MKRTLVAALAISATLVVLSIGSSSADTGGGVEPQDDGSYELCGRHICYTFFEEVFYGYAVNMTHDGQVTKYPVFERVQLENFQATGAPTFGEGVFTIEGSSGTSRAHDIPMGVMSFEANVADTANFQLSADMGAIFSDKSVVIGADDFRGDLVLMGAGTLAKNNQDISVPLQPGDRYYFRAFYLYDESLGSDIADGMIAGEMYLELDGQNLISSVIDYQAIDMEVQFSDEDKVEISAHASFVDGRTVILTIDDSAFDVPLNKMKVELDGKTLQLAGSVKDVISSGEGTYYALHNEDSTQVFINIPHFSHRTITLSRIGPEEIGMDFYLGAAASVLLVVAATVFLFKRKD
ncbi:MAG: hypothetical protein V3U51_03995 [Thermoplasmata archaeon]